MAFDKAVQINANLIGLIPGYTARNDIFQRLNHPESNVRLEAINYIKCQDELCKVRNNNYDSRYKLLDKARLHLTIVPQGLFAAGKPQADCVLTDHTHAKKALLQGSSCANSLTTCSVLFGQNIPE